jgi:hypothetical protein
VYKPSVLLVAENPNYPLGDFVMVKQISPSAKVEDCVAEFISTERTCLDGWKTISTDSELSETSYRINGLVINQFIQDCGEVLSQRYYDVPEVEWDLL